jgi:tetratricopeptide (TPR) repeat protein
VHCCWRYQFVVETKSKIGINQAIRLDSNIAEAYNSRGLAYHNLKQYQLATADYDQSIRLDPNLAAAYYNRGNTYRDLKQHQQAIADYDQSIRLEPNSAASYKNRGITFITASQVNAGCDDLIHACQLGVCDAYEFTRQKGLCR